MNDISYVFALITTEEIPLDDFSGTGKWVMVDHKFRGWELPGGHLKEEESYEEAIIREVFEETGLKAHVKQKPKKIGEGLVFLMTINANDSLKLSSSQDPIINEARWFSKPPEKLAWGLTELKKIIRLFN